MGTAPSTPRRSARPQEAAEDLIGAFIGEKAYPTRSDFWEKLFELPFTLQWEEHRVLQACELFVENNGQTRHLAKVLVHLVWCLQDSMSTSSGSAATYAKAINAAYISSVFLKLLIENAKTDNFKELHLNLDGDETDQDILPKGQSIESFVMRGILNFIGGSDISPHSCLLHHELLNLTLVAISTQLRSGPSPGPKDVHPFIDAAIFQESAIVASAVHKLLLNFITRPCISLNSPVFSILSEGTQPGVLRRVGSVAANFVLLPYYTFNYLVNSSGEDSSSPLAEKSLLVLLVFIHYRKCVMGDDSVVNNIVKRFDSDSQSKESSHFYSNPFCKALENARDIEFDRVDIEGNAQNGPVVRLPFASLFDTLGSTFRQVTSDRMVERCIAVDREYDRMTWGGLERKERYIAFVRRCSDAGNSEANCILGVQLLSTHGERYAGISRLLGAKESGHEAAAYILGMLYFQEVDTRVVGVELLNMLATGCSSCNCIRGTEPGCLILHCRRKTTSLSWCKTFWKLPNDMSLSSCANAACGRVIGSAWMPDDELRRTFCSPLCRRLTDESSVLLLYSLVHGNSDFLEYVLVRTDMDTLLMPILETLYNASRRTPNQIYMLLIILLILSQDSSFNASIHKQIIPNVPWYQERLVHHTSLGSLMVIILIRTVKYNLSKLRDIYLHTNCLAILANMAPHVHKLSAYASQRLVSLFDMLSRKYTKLADLQNDKVLKVPADYVEEGNLPEDMSAELQIYTDFLRIVLEILNAILTYALPRNPEVVYAIMHRQEVFQPFKNHPRFNELIENIYTVLDFFNSRMDMQQMDGEWSVDKVLQVIILNCRSWRGEGMKMFTQLRFTYEQESHPEEFFIPYVWRLVLSHSFTFSPDAINLFSVDIPLEVSVPPDLDV